MPQFRIPPIGKRFAISPKPLNSSGVVSSAHQNPEVNKPASGHDSSLIFPSSTGDSLARRARNHQNENALAMISVPQLEAWKRGYTMHNRASMGLSLCFIFGVSTSVGMAYGGAAFSVAFTFILLGGGLLGEAYRSLFMKRPLPSYLPYFFDPSEETKAVETYGRKEAHETNKVKGLIQDIEKLEEDRKENYDEKNAAFAKLAQELSFMDPNQSAFVEGVKKLFLSLIENDDGWLSSIALENYPLLSVLSAQAARMNPALRLMATRLLVLTPMADMIGRNPQFFAKAQGLVRFLIEGLSETDELYRAALRQYRL